MAQHSIEVAAALPATSDATYTLGKERPVRGKCIRQRRSTPHPLPCIIVEHGAEGWRGDTAAQRIERLHQRYAGFRSSVASSWLKTRNSGATVLRRNAAGKTKRQTGDGAFGLSDRTKSPLLFELVAQTDSESAVDALDDPPCARNQPALIFHRSAV